MEISEREDAVEKRETGCEEVASEVEGRKTSF